MPQPLDLTVLDAVTLFAGDTELQLVPSLKTRAILAFLAITGRPHSREYLCELFFADTKDPRGSLRWSLSRLRAVLNLDMPRLITNRRNVHLDMSHIRLDLDVVRQTYMNQTPQTPDLLRAALLVSRRPLAHLSMPRQDRFDDWLTQEREMILSMQGHIIKALTAASDLSDEIALKWLRHWVRIAPRSHDAAFALWQRLTQCDQQQEADVVATTYRKMVGNKPGSWYAAAPPLKIPLRRNHEQTIRYCTTADRIRIAYASTGDGPPLVKAANWLNHLELDWDSPIWGDTFRTLSNNHTLIRYDERGNGLSDWNVRQLDFTAFVDDLEAVVDSLGIERFPLLGLSQGCAVSIAYAVRHPERVSALVLVGGYAAGWRHAMTPAQLEQREAVLTLTRHGWGTSNPAYRHIFSQTFMPDADADRLAWFDDFQRRSTSAENAVRFQEAFGDIDVRHLLGQVRVPTLVLHARADQRIPVSHGRELAEAIPNATFVELDSPNHIILGDEPAWQVFMDEITRFLRIHGDAAPSQ
ncbi:pimeloyl-ACP methyl ester carboxylesterase [Yoonia maricola]|uniref:Pimeloyl-ACP methyl ester carboxylesterase n=1 Tax=Yoonia maricola TaxID=420999 RepID=A0A2M8W0I1_9RHOB|nr:alpha/beta hydrolase [Yoonia maricola]PJI84421.1 pimeloyl-ACP methyl ester carboxylesterase [Yoonia maricola]